MNDHQDSEHFAYDKTWEEIEAMLDRAERKQNQHYTAMLDGPKKRRMYQNGGGVGDPVRDRDEAIAFANLLAAERESLDEGEIRPLRSPRLIDRAADLATMLSNPLDAIKASTRYGTLLPTRGQIKAVETPMGAAMQALNPLDDLAFLLTSQASDDKVERAMGPFISLLPLASQRKEALTLLKKIREVKTPS